MIGTGDYPLCGTVEHQDCYSSEVFTADGKFAMGYNSYLDLCMVDESETPIQKLQKKLNELQEIIKDISEICKDI